MSRNALRDIAKNSSSSAVGPERLLFTYGFLACFEEKMRDNPDLSSYMTWYPVFPWKILQRGLVDDENVRQKLF